MRVCIIGAGLAGLTFGALAARAGHAVTVIEKNGVPGGVVALAEQDGFRFEQGPLILTDLLPGESLHEFLKTLDIELPTVRADRGTGLPGLELWHPKEYEGEYWRRDRLKELFPEDSRGLDEYYRFYDTLLRIRFLSLQKQTKLTRLRIALNFLKIKKYEPLSAGELVRRLFTREELRILYTGILADFCADPEEVACFTIPFTNLETAYEKRIPLRKNGKLYYPGFANIVGGCQRLPEALAEDITAHGGRFLYNTVAERVLTENGAVTGVRLTDGTVLPADVVTGCGSARDFFGETVGLSLLDEEYRHILDTFRPMEAVFMLHLGVDYDPLRFMPEPLCYYYGSCDLHGAVEKLRSGVYHNGEDGYLIFVPSAHAPELAPEGCHCVTVYTVCPDTLAEGIWSERAEEYAEHLLELAERQLPELRRHIVTKKIMTAEDYRALTHMSKSSFGGTVPVRDLKNPPHVTPVKGLYFIGQQSENGGGVTAVINGARDAYSASGLRINKEDMK